DIARIPGTLVRFEAPHRVVRALRDLRAVLGDRQVAVMRELTKKFEEIVRGTVSEVADRMAQPPPRGELTVVVAGAQPVRGEASGRAKIPPDDPAAHLRGLLRSGVPVKDAVRQGAQAHRMPRRAVYGMAVVRKGNGQ